MDIILPDFKRLATYEGVTDSSGNDRISQLSDEVLCHILSFLTTKEAVATSILSKRWEYVWISTPDVDFTEQVQFCHHSGNYCMDTAKSFKDYVDRVLFYHGWTIIRKCSLSCANASPYIYGWVCAVIACSVQKLTIESRCGRVNELPWRLFICRTLVELEIKGRLVLNVPTHVFLPYLKILSLKDVVYGDGASAWRLFSSCPTLEDLSIRRNEWDCLDVMSISVASLKRLSISSSRYCHGRDEFKTNIDCPCVEYFELYGKSSWKEFSVNFSSCLLEAHIHSTCGLDLWKGISQVKFLELSNYVMSSLKIGNNEYSVPTFPNLVEVDIHVSKLVYWDFLPSLLKNSPNLEVLVFPKGLVVPKEHGSGFCGFDWHNPESVPDCLISHLRIIEISNFVGMLGEVYFVKYMLEYGEALESIKIECCDLGRRWGRKRKLEKHLRYLQNCEKASSFCELLIIDPDTDTDTDAD